MLLCLFGVSSLPHAALESQANGSRSSSINYAKQTIRDSSPLPNQSARSRFVTPMRNAKLDYGIVQPLFLSTLPSPYVISPLVVELSIPQSLAVFNPTTRSPPV